MPLSSLFRRQKQEELPYRRDPSVDPVGEYASDQLDPSLQLHWAGNPDLADAPASAAREATISALVPRVKPAAEARRQTTSRALQTIRERQLSKSG